MSDVKTPNQVISLRIFIFYGHANVSEDPKLGEYYSTFNKHILWRDKKIEEETNKFK